jgi:hypothetical protein
LVVARPKGHARSTIFRTSPDGGQQFPARRQLLDTRR